MTSLFGTHLNRNMAIYMTPDANTCKTPIERLPLPSASWLLEADHDALLFYFGSELSTKKLPNEENWAACSDKRYPVMKLLIGETYGDRRVLYEGSARNINWPSPEEFLEKGYRIEEGDLQRVYVLTRDGLGPDGHGTLHEEEQIDRYICWGPSVPDDHPTM